MEKRINVLLERYLIKFKDDIKKKVTELNFQDNHNSNELIGFVYEYERLLFVKEDFLKRKRLQNIIPDDNRCMAKKSCNEQCTRRRKIDSDFCGTHSKYTMAISNDNSLTKSVIVTAKEIGGIVYYIDDIQNIYRTEDILNEIVNPSVVGRYIKSIDGIYQITTLGNYSTPSL
jgi:hypothetical protein